MEFEKWNRNHIVYMIDWEKAFSEVKSHFNKICTPFRCVQLLLKWFFCEMNKTQSKGQCNFVHSTENPLKQKL